MTRSDASNEQRRCRSCDEPLEASKKSTARYCGSTCRVHAHRARKAQSGMPERRDG